MAGIVNSRIVSSLSTGPSPSRPTDRRGAEILRWTLTIRYARLSNPYPNTVVDCGGKGVRRDGINTLELQVDELLQTGSIETGFLDE